MLQFFKNIFRKNESEANVSTEIPASIHEQFVWGKHTGTRLEYDSRVWRLRMHYTYQFEDRITDVYKLVDEDMYMNELYLLVYVRPYLKHYRISKSMQIHHFDDHFSWPHEFKIPPLHLTTTHGQKYQFKAVGTAYQTERNIPIAYYASPEQKRFVCMEGSIDGFKKDNLKILEGKWVKHQEFSLIDM